MTEFGRKVVVALIGLGRAGEIHFNNLISNYRVTLKWIVEEDVEKANHFVQKYLLYDTKVVNSNEIGQVLEDTSVDAVIVCTPTWTHESIIQASLKAGKHVFCEKPIAASIESTKMCYNDAEIYNKVLFCAFNRRFDPGVRQVCMRGRAGEVGAIHQVKTISRDAPFPPISFLKTSGGIFHDCAIHDIDMICWIVGETPCTVYAQGHAFNDEIAAMDDIDTVAITMKFPCGALGIIDLARDAAYGYDQRLEVFGAKGMLQHDNMKDCEVSHHKTDGQAIHPILKSFKQRYAQSYINELQQFIDSITGVSEKCEVSCDETIRASIVAEACEESYRLGKPIRIEDGKMVLK